MQPVSVVASILAFLFFISIPITTTIILTYVFSRFVFLTRSNGRAGVDEWLSETKHHFISRMPQATRKNPAKQEHLHDSEEDRVPLAENNFPS
jgi:hypothetical protein